MNNIIISRTGGQFSVASSEYLVIFPDGTQMTFWSPPWHPWTEEEEDKEALLYAEELWLHMNENKEALNE